MEETGGHLSFPSYTGTPSSSSLLNYVNDYVKILHNVCCYFNVNVTCILYFHVFYCQIVSLCLLGKIILHVLYEKKLSCDT